MAEEDDFEKQAKVALIDEDYEMAVELFTKAIAGDPSNSASLLASRAQAHIKLGNFTEAVADCTRAIELNPSISKAFLRKGIACFELEEYETAKSAFAAGENLEPSNSAYRTWLKKCDDAIAAEDAKSEERFLGSTPSGVNDSCETVRLTTTSENSNLQQPKPKQKIRESFYQSMNEAVVEIMAKGLRPEEVKVDFGVQTLKVVVNSSSYEPYIVQRRLNQKVFVDKCKYTILSTKVEIRLAKQESLMWKALEYSESQVVLQAPSAAVKSVANTKLDYPSSSRRGNKDWDKLEAEVKKEEKDEKLEGDAALNKLFRDIYQNADEDTRRAMNKSFSESNGTVLSTNWKDVGKKYVKGSPPSGMEMKKWEL